MSETPVACSLDARKLSARLDLMRGMSGALRTAERSDSGWRLVFESSEATHQKLEQIIAAESQCCAFLDLVLSREKDDLVLTMRAPDGGEVIADEIASALGANRVPAEHESRAGRS